MLSFTDLDRATCCPLRKRRYTLPGPQKLGTGATRYLRSPRSQDRDLGHPVVLSHSDQSTHGLAIVWRYLSGMGKGFTLPQSELLKTEV